MSEPTHVGCYGNFMQRRPGSAGVPPACSSFRAPDSPPGRRRSQEVHGEGERKSNRAGPERPVLRCRGWIVVSPLHLFHQSDVRADSRRLPREFYVSGNADLGALASRRRVPVFGSRLAAGTAALPGGSWEASVNVIEPCRRPALRCRGWIVVSPAPSFPPKRCQSRLTSAATGILCERQRRPGSAGVPPACSSFRLPTRRRDGGAPRDSWEGERKSNRAVPEAGAPMPRMDRGLVRLHLFHQSDVRADSRRLPREFYVSGNTDLGALASRRRVPIFGSRLAGGTPALPGQSRLTPAATMILRESSVGRLANWTGRRAVCSSGKEWETSNRARSSWREKTSGRLSALEGESEE